MGFSRYSVSIFCLLATILIALSFSMMFSITPFHFLHTQMFKEGLNLDIDLPEDYPTDYVVKTQSVSSDISYNAGTLPPQKMLTQTDAKTILYETILPFQKKLNKTLNTLHLDSINKNFEKIFKIDNRLDNSDNLITGKDIISNQDVLDNLTNYTFIPDPSANTTSDIEIVGEINKSIAKYKIYREQDNKEVIELYKELFVDMSNNISKIELRGYQDPGFTTVVKSVSRSPKYYGNDSSFHRIYNYIDSNKTQLNTSVDEDEINKKLKEGGSI